MWSEDGIFSKEGTCRVFDEKSDGTVRGAGYVEPFEQFQTPEPCELLQLWLLLTEAEIRSETRRQGTGNDQRLGDEQ